MPMRGIHGKYLGSIIPLWGDSFQEGSRAKASVIPKMADSGCMILKN